jgi:hypothetical protein
VPLEVGGCQQIVKKDDEVLFADATQEKINFLKLTGPDWSYRGEVTFEERGGDPNKERRRQ